MNDERIRVHVVQEQDRANLAMRYRDPVTHRHVKRSTGTADGKEAKKAAAVWERDLNNGTYTAPVKVAWCDFRKRYETEYLPAWPRAPNPKSSPSSTCWSGSSTRNGSAIWTPAG